MQLARPVCIAVFLICIWSLTLACRSHADSSTTRPAPPAVASLFDPNRHMRVADVREGMVGYGLSVFQGSKIERFDVEVVSILANFNPKRDVVLIRCKGDFLKHTGSIAGMSGSPIFLHCDDGKDRMIGAFAYGWPLTKDPVAGVQPIEYMLDLPTAPRPVTPAATNHPDQPLQQRAAWSLKDAGMLPIFRGAGGQMPNALAGGRLPIAAATSIQPLATPLMTSGLSPAVMSAMSDRFRAVGLIPIEAGGGAASRPAAALRLEPGAALAAPLVTGDMEMTAIGTVTETLGQRVWGFGHPFMNEGAIHLPMGTGIINGVIANLQTSFKLGALASAQGTLNTDSSVGVAGEVGASPTMIPLDVDVTGPGASKATHYHFNIASHPKLTANLAAAAFNGAVTGANDLPQNNTVDYELTVSFETGQTIKLANRAVNVVMTDLFGDAAIVMQAAADNPFHRVLVNKLTGSVHIRRSVDAGQILDVNLPRSRYKPGELVKAYVTCLPYHGEPFVTSVSCDLPKDLPAGMYQLVVSDAQRYFSDEQIGKPFRFMAENINDVFTVLSETAAIRENAIYVRLIRQPDGVAIGHTALSQLPSSRREMLLGSGRSNVTAFVRSIVKVFPAELVMTGSADFSIEVEPSSKVGAGAHKADGHPHKLDPLKSPFDSKD